MEHKPLTGIRVLDFTRLFAGPFCTMLLGDLGADTVKVEAPNGDPIRHQGPPFFEDHSMSFMAVNRNKRSVVLDMKTEQGKDRARRMALMADVVVENFRPGVMERLGLGYEGLSVENPRLIYAALSGMGADGPCKDKGGFDLTIQAEGGYMSITGERNSDPIKLGTSAFDLICGQYAVSAITTSLFDRERTGKGQSIQTSLFEAEISFLVDAAMEYFLTGRNRGKLGSQHAAQAPYKAFETADGWIVIGAGMQNLYESFMKVMGREDLITDQRFGSVSDRSANRDVLHEILDAEVKTYATADLLEKLTAANVPCAPVNNMEQVFNHPQALHRGMIQRVTHHRYGEVRVVGPAVKYGTFDIAADWTAPADLGEHTAEVLKEWLGIDEA
ncbi:MAG: CoA transferase [Proteobacteria bacterium]|nr:CoA transferase [Pseudomonadota bacterium]